MSRSRRRFADKETLPLLDADIAVEFRTGQNAGQFQQRRFRNKELACVNGFADRSRRDGCPSPHFSPEFVCQDVAQPLRLPGRDSSRPLLTNRKTECRHECRHGRLESQAGEPGWRACATNGFHTPAEKGAQRRPVSGGESPPVPAAPRREGRRGAAWRRLLRHSARQPPARTRRRMSSNHSSTKWTSGVAVPGSAAPDVIIRKRLPSAETS